MPQNETLEEAWRGILTGRHPLYRHWGLYRRLQAMIPSRRRCKNCNAPFTGLGRVLMTLTGRGPYSKNPRFCNF